MYFFKMWNNYRMSHTHIPILKTTKNGELGTQLFKNLKDV